MERLTMPATIDALRPIADYVMDAANEAGLEKKSAYRLRLAVDEIATNIVMHGYDESNSSGDVSIQADIDDKSLTITLEDSAVPIQSPRPPNAQ